MRDAQTHLERAINHLKYITMELKLAEENGAEVNSKNEFEDFCSTLKADLEHEIEETKPPFKPSGDSRYV
ncbi:hypothetical protein N9878_00625 [bacterium]|nr:hypothetical protein [bacterium]